VARSADFQGSYYSLAGEGAGGAGELGFHLLAARAFNREDRKGNAAKVAKKFKIPELICYSRFNGAFFGKETKPQDKGETDGFKNRYNNAGRTTVPCLNHSI
jgi:hypothetical protein